MQIPASPISIMPKRQTESHPPHIMTQCDDMAYLANDLLR